MAESAALEWLRFARGRSKPTAGPIHLLHRRVYILPTRRGLAFACALMFMLIASINYSLSLGYMLTFLLTGMAIVAMLHTYRNLVHLSISAGRAEDSFAGEMAAFHVHLDNSKHFPRIAIEVECAGQHSLCDVPDQGGTTVVLRVKAPRRGWLQLPRLRLETRYPLGLLRAWAYAHPDMRALVYPRPDQGHLQEMRGAAHSGAQRESGSGSEDFAGLRTYQSGDNLRHVAWKSAAHSELLLTKMFSAQSAAELIFDFERLPASMDLEARVSRLTRWILLAEEAGLSYGLILPQQRFVPASGPAHQQQCLQALALLGLPTHQI